MNIIMIYDPIYNAVRNCLINMFSLDRRFIKYERKIGALKVKLKEYYITLINS